MLFGPVAQLGERTVRIRKVVGSNPFRSTKKIRDTLLTGVRKTGLDRNYEMSICQAGLDNEKPLYSVKT